jgi:predicted nucleic acid-binding protein
VILLDTNVISEGFRRQPHAGVIAWLDAQPASSLYLCTPVLAELHYGVERIGAGARQDHLRDAVARIESDIFAGRILSLDAATAREYGRLTAKRERAGRPIEQMDALIAAVAVTHRAALATRNGRDFAGLGIDVIDPFEAGL